MGHFAEPLINIRLTQHGSLGQEVCFCSWKKFDAHKYFSKVLFVPSINSLGLLLNGS